jgi:hypothetical protein
MTSSPGGDRYLEARAHEVAFDHGSLVVSLVDGRVLEIPLSWFPSLSNASEDQRERWILIGDGVGIHWEELDEDLSVPALLGCQL